MKTYEFMRRDSKKFYSELIYLSWEASKIVELIYNIERNDFQKRQIIIIENLMYGRIAISPIRNIIERKYTLWSKYKKSSEAHKKPDLHDPYLFNNTEIKILYDYPIVIVIDGSYSLDDEKIKFQNRTTSGSKYPDSIHWYRNYINNFYSLDMVNTNKIKNYNREKKFDFYCWYGGSRRLALANNSSRQIIPYSQQFNYSKLREKKISPFIFIQSCIEYSSIPDDVKRITNYTPHSPCYFDYPPIEYNPWLDYTKIKKLEILTQQIYSKYFVNNPGVPDIIHS